MSPDVIARPPGQPVVTPEFRGQARALIERLTARYTEWAPPLNYIRRNAIALARKRGKVLRDDQMSAVERAWRSLPTTSQLTFEVTPGRDLTVVDTRLVRESMTKPEWSDDHNEPAIVLAAFSLLMTKRRALMHTTVLATVSLRAIADRLIRGNTASDSDILDEMAVIARRARKITGAAQSPKFVIEVPSGEWKGEVAGFVDPTGEKHVAAHVRTFG